MSTTVKVYTATPVFSIAEEVRINVAPDALGEAPVWDHRTERLMWVDILSRCVSCYDVGSNSVRRFGLREDEVGFAVPTTKREIVMCGSQNGLFLLNLDSGRITRVSHPERHLPRNKFNDGKVDPSGRLFAGTMQSKKKVSDRREAGTGRLYRIDHGQHSSPEVVDIVGQVTVSNGLGWSPEGDKMYYIDSTTQQVQEWDFSAKHSELNHKRVVYEMPATEGVPDGLCVDSEGYLWVAALKAGEVRRVNPNLGTVVAVVKVATPLVTSCCFGGPYLSTLFITTARGTTMDVAQTNKDPTAGRLFSVDVGVSGIPMTPFRLKQESNL